MIIARFAYYTLALRYLDSRGRGRVEELPSDKYPGYPWALID